MDGTEHADHIMGEVPGIRMSDTNGMMPQTLDPSSLLLSAHDETMLNSDIVENGLVLSNGLDMNGSLGTNGDLSTYLVNKESGAPRFAPLPYASSRSGLVYDVRMRFHVEPIPKDSDMHPEDPRRIYEVYNELCQAGLVDDPTNPELAGQYVLLRIPARSATEEEILACHSKGSYDFVMSLKGKRP